MAKILIFHFWVSWSDIGSTSVFFERTNDSYDDADEEGRDAG